MATTGKAAGNGSSWSAANLRLGGGTSSGLDGCYPASVLGAPIGGNPDPPPGEAWAGEYAGALGWRERCRATRTVRGSGAALEAVRRKLLERCTAPLSVAVLGGSVSCGKCQSFRRDGCCMAESALTPPPLPPAKESAMVLLGGEGGASDAAAAAAASSGSGGMRDVQAFHEGGCKEEAWPAWLEAILAARRRDACGPGAAPVSVKNLCKVADLEATSALFDYPCQRSNHHTNPPSPSFFLGYTLPRQRAAPTSSCTAWRATRRHCMGQTSSSPRPAPTTSPTSRVETER